MGAAANRCCASERPPQLLFSPELASRDSESVELENTEPGDRGQRGQEPDRRVRFDGEAAPPWLTWKMVAFVLP